MASLGLLLMMVVSIGGYKLNVTSSVAVGVYRASPVPNALARGQLVIIPTPAASVVSWLIPGVGLLKPVAAIAGDEVCVSQGLLWIRGESYGPVLSSSHGYALPRFLEDGCLQIPQGSVFLASRVDRSYDSRYFGTRALTEIQAVAIPLVTW